MLAFATIRLGVFTASRLLPTAKLLFPLANVWPIAVLWPVTANR
jgi:hypothetical protein